MVYFSKQATPNKNRNWIVLYPSGCWIPLTSSLFNTESMICKKNNTSCMQLLTCVYLNMLILHASQNKNDIIRANNEEYYFQK